MSHDVQREIEAQNGTRKVFLAPVLFSLLSVECAAIQNPHADEAAKISQGFNELHGRHLAPEMGSLAAPREVPPEYIDLSQGDFSLGA